MMTTISRLQAARKLRRMRQLGFVNKTTFPNGHTWYTTVTNHGCIQICTHLTGSDRPLLCIVVWPRRKYEFKLDRAGEWVAHVYATNSTEAWRMIHNDHPSATDIHMITKVSH